MEGGKEIIELKKNEEALKGELFEAEKRRKDAENAEKKATQELKKAQETRESATKEEISLLKKQVLKSENEKAEADQKVTELKNELKEVSDKLGVLLNQINETKASVDAKISGNGTTAENAESSSSNSNNEQNLRNPNNNDNNQPIQTSTIGETPSNEQKEAPKNKPTITEDTNPTKTKTETPKAEPTNPEPVSTEVGTHQPEQAPIQPEQVPTQPELTEQQKYDKIVSLLQEVNNSLRMNAAGSYIISANQLAAIDQINQLRSSSQTGAGRLPSRSELVDNKYLLEDEISRLKEEIKREKKAKNKLKKLHELEKKLAGLKNHNNYNYSAANTLEGINQALENGQYRDTPIAFLNERPFIGQLCDNIAQLRQNGAVQLIMPGSQEPIVVMTDQFAASGQDARNSLATCSQKKTPWIAEWISNNTKMSKKQATSMVGTLGVAASIAAIVGIGTWLFTKKDKEGNRSFDFSLGRIGTLAAGLFGLNVGSQMLTGKGPLENLDTFLTTGKTPRSEETYKALDTEGQMGARQSGLQFALLGVPYPQLAEYSSPQTGTVSSIDLQKIRDFHNTRLLAARQAGDTTLTTTINAQLATIEELLRSNTGTQAINTAITNLNLNASDLRNPNNANQTLDSILAKAHENREVWEKFKAEHKLVVVEGKAVEFEKRIYLQEKLTEADLQKMQTEGFFAPETSNGLDPRIAQEIETSFNEFAKDPKNEGLKKEVMPDKKIKIISHGKETIFDPQTRTIEGFKNAAGKPIRFESINEAMKTALFVNNLKATYRSEIADATQVGPFGLATGTQSITFKKHNSELSIMSDLVPLVSTMDREFPTIEAEDNRQFFVNYLNMLWKQDHPK